MKEELGRYPVAVAMRIAGVSQMRFNEAVARGHYPCAPTVMSTAGRMFNVIDILGLCIFAKLMQMDFTARAAASFACNTIQVVSDERIHIERMILTRQPNGQIDCRWRAKGQRRIPEDDAVALTINLDPIWQHINRELAEAGMAGEL